MKIGDIEIKSKVILGPMAGVTTLAYRDFMKPFGVGLSYSEMISDCGIDFGNKKTIEYLATSKVDRPVGLQIFGSSIEHTINAIKYLEEHADYDILDLNFGCPVPKVTKTGAGSAWLKNPDELYTYANEIVRCSSKPVTAKIRLGWDDSSINVFEVSKKLEEAGISAITVHCRTKAQGYSGKANYEAIKGLKETLSIPLVVSGDIFTPEDAKKAIEITNADAVMVARGGVGNPILIKQINEIFETGSYKTSTNLKQQVRFARDFSNALIQQKGERIAIAELRGLIPHFFSSFPGSREIRMQITNKTTSKQSLFEYLDSLIKN